MGTGPRVSFFTLHQVNWMGASQFDYNELVAGVEKLLETRFGENRLHLGKKIVDASIYRRLDPLWVTSIIWTESSFNTKAKSFRGARGLMQLMPTTAKEVLEELPGIDIPHWLDDIGNIALGSYYLKKLLIRFKGNHKLATMAYNLGTSGLLRRMRVSGIPKMKYWFNIERRYRLIIYQVQKSRQMAKADSVKFL